MEELPLIPGYSFQDPAIRDFKMKQKLDYSNGHRVVKDSWVGIGRRPVDAASSAYVPERPEEIEFDPSLTYGRAKKYACRQVIPHYALFAQKCLNFKAFFRQSVYNSPSEHHRVRHVNIIYFLEDDTMCVIEPRVDNAGFQQGKLVRRGKIPKNSAGDLYHWKDLNVGINLEIYGVVYHTVSCDVFTDEFLRSQGIDPGDKEEAPPDSYTQDRFAKLAASRASSATKKPRPTTDDSRRRFLEFDGMVLTFNAMWNDDPYQIMYFLTDDTIAVKEVPISNHGKQPSKLLLKRTKIPKNWTDLPDSYPAIYLERSDDDVVEYYCPMDLKIGETIFIFGRRFLLYDCDPFTRKYYCNMLGLEQPPKMSVGSKSSENRICNETLSTRNVKSCPVATKTVEKEDVIRKIYNHPKKLRYLMSMVAIHPEDQDREFVLEYSLSHGTIKIMEIGKKNSGRRAGCFLAAMLVSKKRVHVGDCDEEIPVYYTPEDFFIGAQINIFNHRFVVTGADLFVLHYVEANQEKFPLEIVNNIREYFSQKTKYEEEMKNETSLEKKALEKPVCNVVIEPVIHPFPQGRLPKGKYCSQCVEIGPAPREVTWADQVQVPCTLTS